MCTYSVTVKIPVNMKSVMVCCVLLVGAFGYDWTPQKLECLKELSIEKSEIENIDGGFQKPSPVDNKAYNDFTECIWTKAGLLQEDGKISREALHALIRGGDEQEDVSDSSPAKSDFDKAFKDCSGIKGENVGQRLVMVQNCFNSVPSTSDVPTNSSDSSESSSSEEKPRIRF